MKCEYIYEYIIFSWWQLYAPFGLLSTIYIVSTVQIFILVTMRNKEQSGRAGTWLETRGWTEHLRIIEVGGDLWRSRNPAPLLKPTPLEQVAQDHIRLGFEYLSRQKPHDVSGQLVPAFGPWCHLTLLAVQQLMLKSPSCFHRFWI